MAALGNVNVTIKANTEDLDADLKEIEKRIRVINNLLAGIKKAIAGLGPIDVEDIEYELEV